MHSSTLLLQMTLPHYYRRRLGVRHRVVAKLILSPPHPTATTTQTRRRTNRLTAVNRVSLIRVHNLPISIIQRGEEVVVITFSTPAAILLLLLLLGRPR